MAFFLRFIPTSVRAALARRLPHLPRALALVWQASRYWTVAWAAILVVRGVLPVATIYLTRDLVDSLVVLLGATGDWAALRPVLLLVVLLGGVLLLTMVLGRLANLVNTAQSELVQDHITSLLHQQALALDLAFHEIPAERDRFHRARNEARTQPVSLLSNSGSLIQHSLTLIAMLGVLLPYGAWLPVVLLLSVLPMLYVSVRNTRREYAWRRHTTEDNRRLNYYDMYLTYQSAAAEMRLFDLGGYFRKQYQALRTRLRHEQIDLLRQRVVGELAAQTIALIAVGATVAWMIWRLAQGLLSLGDLTLFYQTFQRGQSGMNTLMGSLNQIYRNSLFLEDLFVFLDQRPCMTRPAHPAALPAAMQDALRFDHVTFCYPGSERPALRDFSLTIPAGQTIAIVGANGAGKTTLVKLLCRFYDPDAGTVTLDGIDLRQVDPADVWQLITVIFQQPVQYHETAAQNIAFGDLKANPDRSQIEAAACAAGADTPIARLPRGYDTVLSKWFGSTELSVGEWQRVALARAFLRQASIIVLDEPTSAMDSWAEAEWLARFRTLVAGRTTIIITHRFTTAMQADIIYVMDAGQVLEAGSHQELLALHGRYAQSWHAQMRSNARDNGHADPAAEPASFSSVEALEQ
jgi:ATP-binding cassette subfamily B protein